MAMEWRQIVCGNSLSFLIIFTTIYFRKITNNLAVPLLNSCRILPQRWITMQIRQGSTYYTLLRNRISFFKRWHCVAFLCSLLVKTNFRHLSCNLRSPFELFLSPPFICELSATWNIKVLHYSYVLFLHSYSMFTISHMYYYIECTCT